MINKKIIGGLIIGLGCGLAFADNPFVTHMYNADPSAHVFNGVLYVYPSHDVAPPGGSNYAMEDYHVFSTTDLMNYTDHGVGLHQDDVPWGTPNNTFWAPDCNYKAGKYYFYFPHNFKVGVAISDSPTGPFIAEPASIPGANKIDPCLFLDDDGTPYLFYGGGTNSTALQVIVMETNMVDVAVPSEPVNGGIHPNHAPSWKEGAWVFKRNGIYYFTYPVFYPGRETIHYATGNSALGPFTYQGLILDESDSCGTSHHSILEYNGDWYMFYHEDYISGDSYRRSICADKIIFNGDGSIDEVVKTKRGLGIRKVDEAIQVDRYLSSSSGLSTPVFTASTPSGFYLSGIDDNNWVNYPDVDFGANGFVSVSARVASSGSGSIEVRLGGTSGTLLGTIPVTTTGGTSTWDIRTGSLESAGLSVTGIQNLYFVFKGSGSNLFDVDWVRFERTSSAQLQFAGSGFGEVLINGSRKIQSYNIYNEIPQIDVSSFSSIAAVSPNGSAFDGWLLNGTPVSNISTLAAGDIVTATFLQDYPTLSILNTLQAEKYTEESGTQVVAGEGGTVNGAVGYIEDGDYLKFHNVNFGDGSNAERLTAVISSQTAGGTIAVYVDDLAPTSLIGNLPVPGTGDWGVWERVSASMSSITGVHDVYFKFEGATGYLFNVDWLKFGPTFQGLGVLEAEDFTDQSGIQIENMGENGGQNIGYVNNDDYIIYEGVTFAAAATNFQARLSSGSSGGTVSVHLNSLTAPPVCSVSIVGTGTWPGWQQWVTKESAVSISEGSYDVYIKFSGGGGYLLNADWFKFEGIYVPSGYDIWLADNNITTQTGYLDDADGDGINNQLEYALDFTHGAADSFNDKMVMGTNGISASYISKPDMVVKLFYGADLTASLTELSPSATPGGMPAGTVYYLFNASNTAGFFYWSVEEAP